MKARLPKLNVRNWRWVSSTRESRSVFSKSSLSPVVDKKIQQIQKEQEKITDLCEEFTDYSKLYKETPLKVSIKTPRHGYDFKRAENLYYYLSDPDPIPSQRRTLSNGTPEQIKHKLSNLSYLKKYRDYLKSHNFRQPAFMQKLDFNN